MKRVYNNEKKLVLEGLKLQGNPDEIEKKQQYLEKELVEMKREYERLLEEYERDQSDYARIEQFVVDSKGKLDDYQQKLSASAETADNCLLKLKQLEKALEEYEKRKNVLFFIIRSKLNDYLM